MGHVAGSYGIRGWVKVVPGGGAAQALADAIRRLLDSPALRKRLGAAGRRTVATQFRNDANLETVRDLLLAASCNADRPSTAAHGAVIYHG